jgi:hypothetical protein
MTRGVAMQQPISAGATGKYNYERRRKKTEGLRAKIELDPRQNDTN